MPFLGEYSAIETMELHVVNGADESGGKTKVVTNESASSASLLGAACQEFRIPMDPRLGIYTKGNVMLTDRRPIAGYGLKTGDTVYLRPKAEGDDLLFLLNWRVLAAIFLLLAIIGLISNITVYAVTAGKAPFVYGIVIDAGSSHSEATLYHWDGSKFHGTGKAEQVAHEETDAAGISDLQPREVQKTIEGLLESVKKFIPKREVHRTKVYLAATAGMRLLNISDPVRADLNFLAAETAIKGSGMAFGGAGILTGQDEGLSAWLSANYLLDRLPRDRSSADDLVGALDLGGASTQIAFEVPLEEREPEFHMLKLYGHQYNVFSRSYLCFGANEAYNRYLMSLFIETKYNILAPLESPCHNKDFDQQIPLNKFVTPCTRHKDLPENLKDPKYNVTIRILGSGNPTVCQRTVDNLFPDKDCRNRGYQECFKRMNHYIPKINFSALSGFYYTIKELGFNGTTMEELNQDITTFCSVDYTSFKQKYFNNSDKYASLGCFKANYVHALLRNYGVTGMLDKVSFQRQAKGYNLGWSLGYMINATNAIPEAEAYPALIPTPWFIVFLIIFSGVLVTGIFSLLLSRRRKQRLGEVELRTNEPTEKKTMGITESMA